METAELVQKELSGIKTNLEQSVEKVKSDLEKSINELKAAQEKGNPDKVKEVVAEQVKSINESLKEIAEWKKQRQEVDPLNQEAINKMLSELKQINTNTKQTSGKTFHEAFAEAVEKNYDQINDVRTRSSHVIKLDSGLVLKNSPHEIKGDRRIANMDLKTVGTMTTGANLTGDSVVTYSPIQAYLPQQRWNFRDIIETVFSPTGTYVHYAETTGEGSVGQQTEGSAKSQIDFDLSEVKTVNKAYAAFLRVSKQALKSLPFMQGDLPSQLMREFFHYENRTFKSIVAAAANNASPTSETDDVKQIIDYIAYQRTANFEVDYAIVSHTTKANLDKLTYTTGYYANAGGVVSNVGGTTMISGVPILAASWMNDNKVLLVDRSYLRRIEVEGLKVEFFEQDADNVTKNLITVRIECYEQINPMLGSAFLYSNL